MMDLFRVTSTSSDAELISAARSGDQRANGLLAERHAPSALRLARLLAPGPAEAGDTVAETLARVLDAIRRGVGPSEAFRPYLLTAIRRVTLDRVVSQHSLPSPGAEIATPAVPSADVIGASLERSLTVQAYRSLPERWAAVLWHAEIEQARPAELARLFGTSADDVTELADRAREGLRRAYLQIYGSVRTQPECRQVAGKLRDYARDRLSRPEQLRVIGHLTWCRACSTAHAELTGIVDGLRGMVARAVLGEHVTDYLEQGDLSAGRRYPAPAAQNGQADRAPRCAVGGGMPCGGSDRAADGPSCRSALLVSASGTDRAARGPGPARGGWPEYDPRGRPGQAGKNNPPLSAAGFAGTPATGLLLVLGCAVTDRPGDRQSGTLAITHVAPVPWCRRLSQARSDHCHERAAQPGSGGPDRNRCLRSRHGGDRRGIGQHVAAHRDQPAGARSELLPGGPAPARPATMARSRPEPPRRSRSRSSWSVWWAAAALSRPAPSADRGRRPEARPPIPAAGPSALSVLRLSVSAWPGRRLRQRRRARIPRPSCPASGATRRSPLSYRRRCHLELPAWGYR